MQRAAPASQDTSHAEVADLRYQRPGAMVRRGAWLAATGLRTACSMAVGAAQGLARDGRIGAAQQAALHLSRGLERMGPTVIKAGQMAAARRDLLPALWADALGDLLDSTQPMPYPQRDEVWAAVVTESPEARGITLTDTLLGTGSVACVYLGYRDGRELAVKIQRPGTREAMLTDLAILAAIGRLAQRVSRERMAPLGDLIAFMSRAIAAQVDFVREAENHDRLLLTIGWIPGLEVPRREPWAHRLALATELVPGLDRRPLVAAPDSTRSTAARTLLWATHQMVFGDGFVHCDLHPGNVYIHPDGSVTVLDAGYAIELDLEVREQLNDFFVGIAAGNGRMCGEVMFAAGVDPGGLQHVREDFVAAVADHVAQHTGPGKKFTMAEFGERIFDIQAAYGCHTKAEFVYPLMSMMVVEGTLRSLLPTADISRPLGAAS